MLIDSIKKNSFVLHNLILLWWLNLFSDQYNVKSAEAATRGVLYKKVFLEISQNSQENTTARVSLLIKLQA